MAAIPNELSKSYEAALRDLPGVTFPLEKFAARLAVHHPNGAPVDLHTGEFLLASACAAGDAKALQLFSQRILSRLGGVIARIDPSPAFVEEVIQRVRERLLVAGEDHLPRIADYRGVGSLEGWVRVTATRIGLRLVKQRKPEVATDEVQVPDKLAMSPELESLKARYKPEFEAAFREALAALPTRPRMVLKLSALEGLSIDRIGEHFQVHRATAARWITSARETLLAETRRRLEVRVKLEGTELDSLMRLVASQLDLSLNALRSEA